MFDTSEFREPPPEIPTHFHHLPWVDDMLGCVACPIANERSRVVMANGPLDSAFMILGRNPGRDEDREGQPFIGKGGRELDAWLESLHLDRSKIYITNACKCHTSIPKSDRPPTQEEIKTCAELWLKKEIAALPNLRVIIGLGNSVVEFVLGSDAVSTGQLIFYTVRIKLGDRFFDFVPLAHPGYIIRARQLSSRMYHDVLPKIVEWMEKEHPVSYARSKTSYL